MIAVFAAPSSRIFTFLDHVPRVLSILGQNLSPSGALDEATVNAERGIISLCLRFRFILTYFI